MGTKWQNFKIKIKSLISTNEVEIDTKEDADEVIEKVFNEYVSHAKDYTQSMISAVVPKRTGRLQDDLFWWVQNNWDEYAEGNWHDVVILDLKTWVEYADKIKGDPAHFGTDLEHSGRKAYNPDGTRAWLDDPEAILNWQEHILLTLTDEVDFGIMVDIGDYVLGE